MCRFNRSQRAAVDEGLSNAEVDPDREAGLAGGSLALASSRLNPLMILNAKTAPAIAGAASALGDELA